MKQLKIAAIALTASLYAMAADGQIATNGRGKIKFTDSVESYSPSRKYFAVSEAERRDQLRVRLEAGWIVVSVEMRGHHKAGLGVGGANDVEHLFVAVEGLGRLMLGNLGEQAVLDWIPLGGAGRVVSNGDGKAEGITYLPLEFNLPSPGSATVAAAGVGQSQEFGRTSIATHPLPFPPGGDGMSGEGRCVVRDTNADWRMNREVLGLCLKARSSGSDTWPSG